MTNVASGIATVNFCRPPETSETVCHNVPCEKLPPLPKLPPSLEDRLDLFNGTDPCGCGTNITTEVPTIIPPTPGCPECVLIVVPILICLVVGLLLLIFCIKRKRLFKYVYSPAKLSKSLDDSRSSNVEVSRGESRPSSEVRAGPTKEVESHVELQALSSDVETAHNGYEGTSNATLEAEPEAKGQYRCPESAAAASNMETKKEDNRVNESV